MPLQSKVQNSIKSGGAPKAWKDVEVDEACFDKRTLKPWEQSQEDAKKGKNTVWEQWGGMVQRCNPKSLILFKLRPAIAVPRAAGPGAPRKVDLHLLPRNGCFNRRVILHSGIVLHARMRCQLLAVFHARLRRLKRLIP